MMTVLFIALVLTCAVILGLCVSLYAEVRREWRALRSRSGSAPEPVPLPASEEE